MLQQIKMASTAIHHLTTRQLGHYQRVSLLGGGGGYGQPSPPHGHGMVNVTHQSHARQTRNEQRDDYNRNNDILVKWGGCATIGLGRSRIRYGPVQASVR